MNSKQFNELIKLIKIGKQVGNAHYIHVSAFDMISTELKDFIYKTSDALKIQRNNWNIIKLHKQQFQLSFLFYPNFYVDAYPELKTSITANLETNTRKDTNYNKTDNAPILHRKELFVTPDNEHYDDFVTITQEGEAAGLYENNRVIGFKQSWQRIIKRHGYELIDGRLFRARNIGGRHKLSSSNIDRHKTAIVRQALSAPMKALARHNYLDGTYTIFDYGCGLGDDLTELETHGIDATGWDPVHRPDIEKISCELVNLGFVINVIEDRDERIGAIQHAYELTQRLLVVSAMIAGEKHIQKFKSYKDGVITSQNTFQKYYSQTELQVFIEQVLDENAIAVGPGIFFIFKDKLEEQLFLANRQKRHHNWKQLSTRPINNKENFELLFNDNEELFKTFWHKCLALGRVPANDEFHDSKTIRALIGSHNKAFTRLNTLFEDNDFEIAQRYRQEDLMVYFALSLFEKKKPYTKLPTQLQRDVKAFFSNYNLVKESARELLFSISDHDLIISACLKADKELPASVINNHHSLVFHKDFLDLLPPILRIYIGCATQICGELENIHLIKIHFHSGKVSFMGYENFDNTPLPLLKQRIKVNLRHQTVDYFDYIGEYIPQPLFNRSHYLSNEHPNYKKQYSFDKKMEIILPTQKDNGITSEDLLQILNNNQLEIKGFRFYSKKQNQL